MRAQHVFTLEATYQTYIVGPHTRMSIARCKDDMQQICTRYFTVTLPCPAIFLVKDKDTNFTVQLQRLCLLSVIRRKLENCSLVPRSAYGSVSCISNTPAHDRSRSPSKQLRHNSNCVQYSRSCSAPPSCGFFFSVAKVA